MKSFGEEIFEDEPVTASKNDKKDCKPDYSLLPRAFLDQVAYSMMAGEIKYGTFNYLLGHDIRQLTSAAARHLKAIEAGEDLDLDTSRRVSEKYGVEVQITHAACVAANMLMLLDQAAHGTLRDNRYKKGGVI